MATKLMSLKLNELSLVDYPANKQAQMTIHKRSNAGAADNKEQEMDKKEFDDAIAKLKAENDRVVKALTEKVAKLETDNAMAVAKAKMSDDEKAHMEELSEDQKKAFSDMKPDERKKAMGVKKSGDSITVGGIKIFKSRVGEDTFNALKSQSDEIAKNGEAIKKAEEAREMAVLEKRASDEFGDVVGTDVEKAQVLKHMSTASEEVRKSFDAILKAANDTASPAFKRLGHSQGHVDQAVEKAAEPFKKRVAEIRKRDDCSRVEALRKAQGEFPKEFEAFQASGESLSEAA